MNGICACYFTRGDYRTHIKVAVLARCRTDADCLVCYHRVQGVLVGSRIDSDGLNAKLTAGTDYSNSYFATVGDKDFLKHHSSP